MESQTFDFLFTSYFRQCSCSGIEASAVMMLPASVHPTTTNDGSHLDNYVRVAVVSGLSQAAVPIRLWWHGSDDRPSQSNGRR